MASPKADGDGGSREPNVFGIYYVSLVNDNGVVLDGLECPAYVGSHPWRPQLPSSISGFTTQSNGQEAVYFTTGSVGAGGPGVPGPGHQGPG